MRETTARHRIAASGTAIASNATDVGPAGRSK
jgi:hypothetical protein